MKTEFKKYNNFEYNKQKKYNKNSIENIEQEALKT